MIVPPDAAAGRLHHKSMFAHELDVLRRKLDDVVLVDHQRGPWSLIFHSVWGEIDRRRRLVARDLHYAFALDVAPRATHRGGDEHLIVENYRHGCGCCRS
jgi:hypothetical protein